MPLRPFTQTEMIVTKRRRFERPLLVTVWLGIAALGLAEGRIFYPVMATLAVGTSLLALRRDREVYLHRGFIYAAAFATTGILIVELFVIPSNLLQAVGHFVVLLQLCKLFEHKTNRDYVQILTLSGLAMTSACLQCNTPWLAAILVLYLGVASYTAMTFTLKRGLDRAVSDRLATELTPLDPRRIVWNVRGTPLQASDGSTMWPGSVLRRCAFRLLIIALAMGAIMFLAAPRFDRSLGAGESQDRLSGAGGDLVRLGTGGRIRLSDRVVMKVTTTAPPAGGYIRGRTFDSFNSSLWSRTTSFRSAKASAHTAPAENLLDTAHVMDVSMAADLLPTLFVPTSTVWVQSSDGEVSILDDEYMMYETALSDRPAHYRVFFRPTRNRRQPDIAQGLVHVSPRVKELARQWCAELLTQRSSASEAEQEQIDLQIAQTIAQKLRQRCTYTLDLSDADPTRDGVEDFLFHMKKGHCEYFASAMTVMCRSLGLTARLATGFKVDNVPPAGGSFVVRQRDAHAWTEVYTPGEGWMILDATGTAASQETRGIWAAISDMWGSVVFMWNEHVLGYDSLARKQLASRLGRLAEAARLGAVNIGHALKSSILDLLVRGHFNRILRWIALATGDAGLLLACVLLWRTRRQRRIRPNWRAEAAILKQLAFARKLFALLKRHGQARQDAQTVRQWAHASAELLQLPRDTVSQLIETYYALRWGRRTLDDQQLQLADQQVAALAEAMTSRRSSL